MLFSFVVPVYNAEKYLRECVDAIVNQVIDFSEGAEVLLIDDGSTDSSGVICDEYQLLFPQKIKVFHKENQGLLMARRYGFERAQGDYIINCDSDDLCEPTMVKELSCILRKTDADIVIFNFFNFNDSFKRVAFSDLFSKAEVSHVHKEDLFREYFQSDYVVSMCGKTFKRSFVSFHKAAFEGLKIQQGEDTLQSMDIYIQAKAIIYYNRPLYGYRVHSGMTSKFDSNYYDNFKNVLSLIENYRKEWLTQKWEGNGLDGEDFNRLLTNKFFRIVGRSITQMRNEKRFHMKEKRLFLERIRNDATFIHYIRKFNGIKKELPTKYILFIELLRFRQYKTILLLLQGYGCFREIVRVKAN